MKKLKAGAYISKIILEIITFLFFTIILIDLLLVSLYIFYLTAYKNHIPLENFTLFVNDIFAMCAAIAIVSIVVIHGLTLNWREGTKLRKYRFLFFIELAIFCVAVSSNEFSFNYTEVWEAVSIGNQIGVKLLISLAIFFLINRIIGNELFRRLFTEEFQKRCDIYKDEDDYNGIYQGKWIVKIVNFVIKYFRNYKRTIYNPFEDDNRTVAYKYKIEYPDQSKAYVEKPNYIYDNQRKVNEMTVQFKWVPFDFVIVEKYEFYEKEKCSDVEARRIN